MIFLHFKRYLNQGDLLLSQRPSSSCTFLDSVAISSHSSSFQHPSLLFWNSFSISQSRYLRDSCLSRICYRKASCCCGVWRESICLTIDLSEFIWLPSQSIVGILMRVQRPRLSAGRQTRFGARLPEKLSVWKGRNLATPKRNLSTTQRTLIQSVKSRALQNEQVSLSKFHKSKLKKRPHTAFSKSTHPPPSKNLIRLDFSLFKHFQLNRHNLMNPHFHKTPLAKVEALSYAAFTYDLTPLLKVNSNVRRQIASLTKIFTCLGAILISLKLKLRPQLLIVRVSQRACTMIGTSAGLNPGDKLTLMELLYGLMLPSGNDAAYCIAQFCGRELIKYFQRQKLPSKRNSVKFFLLYLNKMVKDLGLQNTHLANPHGLQNSLGYSTAEDVAVFSALALRNQLFSRIVATKQFKCKIINQRTKVQRQVCWLNTNKLLQSDNCVGTKTGFTPSAGPCFSGAFKRGEEGVVVVLLRSGGMRERLRESVLVAEWLGVGGWSRLREEQIQFQQDEAYQF